MKARLNTNLSSVKSKRGRPYLDYSLQLHRGVAYRLRYDDDSNTLFTGHRVYDAGLVEMLLSHGCKVNQQIWIYDGRTVWDLHLASIHGYRDSIDLNSVLTVTKLLIKAGAKDVPKCILCEKLQEPTAKYHEQSSRYKELSMCQVLDVVFGEEQGKQLSEEVRRGNTGSWFPWRFGWP